MAQLSRPYQVALAAMAALVLVWFVALRGHAGNTSEPAPSVSSKPSSSSSTSSSSSASSSRSASPSGRPSSAATAAAEGRSAGKATPVYHGAAPGVEGLTRAIAKAHGAVALSQQKGADLQRRSAAASGEAPQSKAAAPAPSATAKTQAVKGAPSVRGSGDAIQRRSPDTSSSAASKRPVQQVTVERELTHGKTVLLLFWNPTSSVDATVRSQALALGRGSKGKLDVHVARAGQVGLFGPVTEVAHVYQTPTVLIVGRHGLVSALTGLVDSFGLHQAVIEAEHVNG